MAAASAVAGSGSRESQQPQQQQQHCLKRRMRRQALEYKEGMCSRMQSLWISSDAYALPLAFTFLAVGIDPTIESYTVCLSVCKAECAVSFLYILPAQSLHGHRTLGLQCIVVPCLGTHKDVFGWSRCCQALS